MHPPPPPSPTTAEVQAELLAERARLHRRVLAGSLGASALMGLGLMVLLWPHADPARLLGWLASLLLVGILRWVVALGGAHADGRQDASRWLWRYRIGFVLHGLVWAMACVLLMPEAAPRQLQLLAYATIAVTAGSLVLTAFDLAAALLLMLPALGALAWSIAPRADVDRLAFLVEALVLHAAAGIAAVQARRMVRDAARLRLVQAALTEEARSQAAQASQARQELAERNYLFPWLLQTTEQGYWFVDAQGRTGDVNPAMCRMLGRARAQVLGQRFEDLLEGTDLRAVQAQSVALQAQSALAVELGIRRPDGTRSHCLVHFTRVRDPRGQDAGLVGLWTDITARKQSEQALRTYELAINSISDMVSVVDEHTNYRMVNDAWCRLSGNARPDVLGKPAVVALPGGVTDRRRTALRDCLDQNAPRSVRDSLDLPGLRNRIVETTYYPYVSQEDGHRSVVMVTRDVTAEQQSLDSTREREAQQRALLDAFPGFITRMDEHQVYTYANERVAARLGITVDRMIGRSLREVSGDEVAGTLAGPIAQALAGEAVTYERRHRRSDGEDLFDQVTLVRGEDRHTGRPVLYSFGVDITDRKRAERQLQAAGEQLAQATAALQTTLDNMTQGIVCLDAEGRVDVHNQRVLELLDLPAHLLAPGVRYDDVLVYQRSQGELQADFGFVDVEGQRRYFTGGRVNSPDRYVRRTRRGTVLEVRTRQLPGGGLVRTYADVSAYFDAQQALRDSEAELRTLLDAFPGHIVAANQAGVFSYVNGRVAEMLGLPVDAIVGHSIHALQGEAPRRLQEALGLQSAQEGAVVQERSYQPPDGRPRLELEVSSVAGPLRQDGTRNFYAFGMDITARKRAEEALVAARDLAESASRAKSEFLASMSHELRTPLNAILGFSQLFALDPALPPTTRAGAAEIERAGRHLLALVDDLIDLARIESGRLDLRLEPVALLPVLEAVGDMVQPLAQNQGVSLRIAPGVPDLVVTADQVRLRQVLINLLSNAIKYNRAGGAVRVEFARQGDRVRISVADTGIGIAADKSDRLFNAFDRLGAERGRVEGAGIGLVITRRLVEAMGGDIGFESTPGVGSVFRVGLPLAASAGAPVSPARAPTALFAELPVPLAREQRRRVLYVEDNLVNAAIMEHLLGRLPQVECQIAGSAEQGLDMIFRDPPALVLMDVHLPGMSGLDAVRALRRDPRTSRLPVFAVSAAAMPQDVDQGMQAGFDAYLTKPFDVEQLLQAVMRVLEPSAPQQ